MKPLRIHYFQHVAFEGLGYIQTWANEKGHALSVTKFYVEDHLPLISDLDWLVILGGPMGVYDEEEFPWLIKEKEFIAQAIISGKTVLGICLGAQLIASVLGAKVYPAKQKEIGWFPITKTLSGKQQPFIKDLADSLVVFHWHGDTFDLPKGAVNLFQTETCVNQAFLYKQSVLGLQFHLEATIDTVSAMLENGRDELVAGEFVQNENQMLNNLSLCQSSNSVLEGLLNQLAEER